MLELVRNGQPRFCIEVRPPQDADALLHVTSELVTHLEKSVGAPVIWFDRWAKEQPPVRFVIRLDVLRDLESEEFEVTAAETSLTLTGKTVQAVGHAVHWFLERAFGVRWLWPGETGTVTPPAKDVRWPTGTSRHKPDWAWRRLWVGGSFWKEDDASLAELKFGRIRPATLEGQRLWQERNRLGGLRIADGHRWAQLCSPLVYGESHPEYFALIDGKRDTKYVDGKHGNQLCTSNGDVVKLVADSIKAQFRARPELDGFSIAPNDGHGFCECEQCRQVDAWANAGEHQDDVFDAETAEGTTELDKGRSGRPALTDRMLRFANAVAEQVAEEFPDKLLLTLIYSVYRTPPRRVKLHPNVIAQFCTMTWAHVSEPVREKEIEMLAGIQDFTERRGIYDYFVNGVNGSMPRGFARTFHRSVREYYALGCRHFATQAGFDFALGGFNYYLAGRMLWDMDTKLEDALEDYSVSGFGPGATLVRRFLAAFIDRWEETEGGTSLGASAMEERAVALYPSEWRAARREELVEAAKLCGEAPDVLRRVEFLHKGLNFLDRLVEACAAVRELVKAGAPAERRPNLEVVRAWADAEDHRSMIARAVQARRHLLDWVEAHRDGYWITAMWFDYQCLVRGGRLGQWLDAFG